MTAMGSIGLHSKNEIRLEDIISELKAQPATKKAGVIACFVGFVREEPIREGTSKVVRLQYEAYKDVAEKMLTEIRKDIMKQSGVVDLSIHHIIDEVSVGEDSLYVAVMTEHRDEAFKALKETVERVKFDVPIWKKEVTTVESYWVPAKK